ncbi:MAG: CRISPR-associated protein Csx11 [Candidatus Methanofastidiosia archaeon]
MNDEGLKRFRNVVLMAEIGALIHDLGKISEEFIESKSKDSKIKFLHHLILRRLISRIDPYVSHQSTEKDLVLCLVKQLDFFNELQLDNPGQLTNILGDIERELKDPSRQNNLQSGFGQEFGQHILGSLVKNKQENEKEDIKKIFAEIKKLEEQTENEKNISPNFISVRVKKSLNANLKNHFVPFFISQKQISNLGDFIEMHHKTWHQDLPFLMKLLRAPDGCDGVDSGIDKNTPIEQQELFQTYISTAFGYDKNRIVPSSLTQERIKFCRVLESQLQKVIDAEEKTVEDTIVHARKEIVEAAKKHFAAALGETRRAANDVTLWDHSYSVASLLKAALAGIILEHESSSSYTLPQPKDLKWRIFTINVNGLDFWMKSEKIGDIIARKNLIKECFDETKNLFEVDIPLGNEIYRDENCISFLVHNKFSEDLRLESENMTLKEKIISIFVKNLDSELKPHLEISKESKGAATIGELLRKARKINNPLGRDIEQHWRSIKLESQKNSESEVEICRVCGIRAVFPHNEKSAKAKKRHMCTVCLERREKRSEKWMKEATKEKDTIWIDEIADPNNRVALIIGKFDLGNWLDGTYLNTMFTKTLSDLHNSEKKGLEKKKGIGGLTGYFHLLEAAKQSFSSDEIKIGQQRISTKEFLESIGRESYHSEKTNNYFEALVLDREKEKLETELGDPDKWDTETKARLLLSFLFRKNPSFARTRRLWETTLDFWEEVDNDIKNTKKTKRLLPVDQRYEITLKEELQDISISHAYYLKTSGLLVPAVAHDKKTMLIVEKEEKFPEILSEPIRNKEKPKGKIEVLESDKKTSKGEIEIENIKRHSTYVPYINILKEPTVFISLLPAEKAFEAVRQIKEKYEIEFSKVKNRLPLNLYIIFMNKKMPLYIALDSAKRFLQFKNPEEPFEILGMCDKKLKNGEFKKKGLALRGRRILETEFDLTLGNGKIDYYHPYFVIEQARCPDQRTTYFETYLKEKLLHVKDLVVTDVVRYTPSFFDFVFLDSNIRRFDVSMKNGVRPHAIFKKGPRPYYLEEIDKIHQIWEILKEYCDNTQLNNFDTLLLSKIEEWNLRDLDNLSKNKEFRELVDASIRNILRIDNEDDLEVILESVLSGIFFDVKELYHTILKKKLRGDEHE